MRTSLQMARGGALLALVALLAGASAVHAAGVAKPAHRYSIYGSLDVEAAEKTKAGAPMSLAARLSAPSKDVGLQSGGDFVVMARLAESPQGCSGSDTIFTDGFDP